MKDLTTEEAVEYVKDILKYPKLYASTENEGDFLRGIDKNKIEKILNELENKDKIIDAMALQLFGVLIWDDKKEELITLDTAEEVKQYFERNVKDEKI